MAADHIDLTVNDGEFVVLVGPSGCGKTTVLRLIAGLEEITSGPVEINGQVVNGVSPHDRDIAMVFQSYALYPHMTVAENIGFTPRLRSWSISGQRAGWPSRQSRSRPPDRVRRPRGCEVDSICA